MRQLPPTSPEQATFSLPTEDRAEPGVRGRLRGGGGSPRAFAAATEKRLLPHLTRRVPDARPGPPPAPPQLPFRRKKDMAGPGSGRRARGDCRGEGPAPLIQQLPGLPGPQAPRTIPKRNPSSGCGLHCLLGMPRELPPPYYQQAARREFRSFPARGFTGGPAAGHAPSRSPPPVSARARAHATHVTDACGLRLFPVTWCLQLETVPALAF